MGREGERRPPHRGEATPTQPLTAHTPASSFWVKTKRQGIRESQTNHDSQYSHLCFLVYRQGIRHHNTSSTANTATFIRFNLLTPSCVKGGWVGKETSRSVPLGKQVPNRRVFERVYLSLFTETHIAPARSSRFLETISRPSAFSRLGQSPDCPRIRHL